MGRIACWSGMLCAGALILLSSGPSNALEPHADDIEVRVESTRGMVDGDALLASLERQLSTLESCFDQAIQKRDVDSSRTEAVIYADSDGAVFAVRGLHSPGGRTPLDGCALAEMGDWRIAPTQNEGISRAEIVVEYGPKIREESTKRRRTPTEKPKHEAMINTVGATSPDVLDDGNADRVDRQREAFVDANHPARKGPKMRSVGPRFAFGEVNAPEGVDAEVVVASVNRKRDELRDCYETRLFDDDSVRGTMTLTLDFGEERTPSALGVTSEMPEPMKTCVKEVISVDDARLVAGDPGQVVEIELKFRR